MPRLRIVSINTTHSQEDKIPRCSTDKEWAQAIGLCLLHNEPLYVALYGHEDYLRRYFINQTLNSDGYIIPGDYETETPEHGKVEYSIWTEWSNYCAALTRKPVVDKMLDMMIDDANKVCEAHRKVLFYQLLLATPAMIDGEIKINDGYGDQGARGVQKGV